jgi:hypothetical protein
VENEATSASHALFNFLFAEILGIGVRYCSGTLSIILKFITAGTFQTGKPPHHYLTTAPLLSWQHSTPATDIHSSAHTQQPSHIHPAALLPPTAAHAALSSRCLGAGHTHTHIHTNQSTRPSHTYPAALSPPAAARAALSSGCWGWAAGGGLLGWAEEMCRLAFLLAAWVVLLGPGAAAVAAAGE